MTQTIKTWNKNNKAVTLYNVREFNYFNNPLTPYEGGEGYETQRYIVSLTWTESDDFGGEQELERVYRFKTRHAAFNFVKSYLD